MWGDDFQIKYRFLISDQRVEEFVLQFRGRDGALQSHLPDPAPSWTALEFNQCAHCPLRAEGHPQCPVAHHLVDMVDRFADLLSYDEVKVEVVTEQRVVASQTTMQRGISSLMGLMMATCGCPHMEYFKPMARFHLPFSDGDETMYRAASMYVMAQYFRKKSGLSWDEGFDGLTTIYDNIHKVNKGLAQRLREACEKDSTVNAVVLLDLFTMLVPPSIAMVMDEMKDLFSAYLAHDSQEGAPDEA